MVVVNGLIIWHLSVHVVDLWSINLITIVILVSIFAECEDSVINLSHMNFKDLHMCCVCKL